MHLLTLKIKWSPKYGHVTTRYSFKESSYMTTTWLFQDAGDIIELDAWCTRRCN